MREKLIPVDSIEIKEQIHAFAWEPVGSKFAIVHGEPKNVTVSFYNVKTKQDPVCLSKFFYVLIFNETQLKLCCFKFRVLERMFKPKGALYLKQDKGNL